MGSDGSHFCLLVKESLCVASNSGFIPSMHYRSWAYFLRGSSYNSYREVLANFPIRIFFIPELFIPPYAKKTNQIREILKKLAPTNACHVLASRCLSVAKYKAIGIMFTYRRCLLAMTKEESDPDLSLLCCQTFQHRKPTQAGSKYVCVIFQKRNEIVHIGSSIYLASVYCVE